jgi:lysophospholipid hydrolase
MTASEPGTMMKVAERVMTKTFSTRGMLSDFNFPRTAYFTGHYLNHVLQQTFARRRCEDMLVPLICTSTDILNFKAKSHRERPLWHVIRASMSLVGFVPPLPHQERNEDGHISSCLLVDGGYTNQYPTEELRQSGVGVVISASACPDFDPVSTDYGDKVTGGRILLLRLLGIQWRWFEGPDPPPQAEIQERLMFLPDTMLGDVSTRSDLHLKPPIDGFGLLEFKRFKELEEIGYKTALPILKAWLAGDTEGAQHVRNIIDRARESTSAQNKFGLPGTLPQWASAPVIDTESH